MSPSNAKKRDGKTPETFDKRRTRPPKAMAVLLLPTVPRKILHAADSRQAVLFVFEISPQGEWADPGGTAIPGQPVEKSEQAPESSPSSKNQFNIIVTQ